MVEYRLAKARVAGSNPVSCCFVKPCKYRKILIFARFFVVFIGIIIKFNSSETEIFWGYVSHEYHTKSHAVYRVKMFVDFFILPHGFQINRIPVNRFHDVIADPPAALQNILVGDADRVHD